MKPQPRNVFYFLLMIVSVAFVVTALAHAVVPWEQQPLWLQARGWQILLVEVAAIILFGLASMGFDARCQESGIRSQESGVRGQQPGVRGQESGVSNPEAKAGL